MSIPNRPTIVYPNGGEQSLSRVIEISWIEPSPLSIDSNTAWYELYFTDEYDDLQDPDWKQIGTSPAGTNVFQWKVGSSVHSKDVRVAICSVNARGERSEFSVSAASFEIKKSQPLTPSVLSPSPGSRHGSSVEIVLDDSAVRNTFAQRAKYYIFFSSQKAGIPLAPIAQKIPVGTGPIVWDTSLIKPSDDYVITVYLADDDGSKSEEVDIDNLTITNEGFFLIDTKPPSGFVLINRGDQFTRDPNVTVQLYSFDETTGVNSLQFKDGDTLSGAESYTNLKYYKFVNTSDGLKTLEVIFQDYGGNRSAQILRAFRPYFEVDNQDISDMILQVSNGTLWIACNSPTPAVYKDNRGTSLAANVNEKINALALLNDTLYISAHSSDGTALIYRLSGNVLTEALSLPYLGSEAISLEGFRGKLYLGSSSGALYVYDEISVELLNTFSSSIQKMYTDGFLLYIILKNSSAVFVYDGVNITEAGS